jgi:hypothetical protein
MQLQHTFFNLRLVLLAGSAGDVEVNIVASIHFNVVAALKREVAHCKPRRVTNRLLATPRLATSSRLRPPRTEPALLARPQLVLRLARQPLGDGLQGVCAVVRHPLCSSG